MVHRLPDHVLHLLVMRIKANEPVQQIHKALGVSRVTIYKILDNLENWGQPYGPPTVKLGRERLLAECHVEGLLQFLDDQPAAYLDEMQQFIYDSYDIDITTKSIWVYLQRAGWSRKAVQAKAAERNELLRATWRGLQPLWDDNQLVFIDESAANERTADRRYGWSPKGVQCQVLRPLKRSERWSVLPALYNHGYMDWMVHQGAITAELFIELLQERVLPNCTPYPGPRSILIMDNASIHKNIRV